MTVPPACIVPLAPTVRSAAAVRRAIGFEDVAAAHPRHEIFVVWHRQNEAAPFAFALAIPKARIAENGWPLYFDRDTRVLEICAAKPD
jgi:hypothetical protein